MLINGRSIAAGCRLKAGICIVGTGMGAISVACKLVDAGADILFIEAGPLTAGRRDVAPLRIEETGRPFRLPRSRGLEVGGGTAFWHGVCAPLDEIDFERRDWVPHSGWPIGRGDMEEPYRQAWDFLCGGDHGALGGSGAVKDGLRQLPSAADVFEDKVYQFRSPPFRGKDKILAWSGQDRIRCVTDAVALQLSGDGWGVVRELVVGSAGRTFTVEAQAFIIAAGALETPRLLLNSSMGPESRLGLDSWWLGRNLIDHPAAYVSQVLFGKRVPGHLFSGFDIGANMHGLPGFVFAPEMQRRHALLNHTLFIRPGLNAHKVPNRELMSFLGVRGVRDLRPTHVKAMLTAPYIRWRVLHQRLRLDSWTAYGDLFFMTEQAPNPDSRVELSATRKDAYGYSVARVNWQLSRDEIEGFGRALALAMESFSRHPEIHSVRKDGIGDWLDSVCSAAHHLGTARMASSPRDGVVDPNLKVFGAANVWICDGSVFPTAGSVNPSLTICALGHRLGSHLLDSQKWLYS